MRVLCSLLVVASFCLCACSTTSIDNMNKGLSESMSSHISKLEDAFGKPAEVAREGNRTRYRWFAESHIEPCNVDVWADFDGLVRKTSWTGYAGACEKFAAGLNRVFP